MPTRAELHEAARTAASDWSLVPERVELISLSENAVFRIDCAGGDRVVMRLHRPGYNSPDEMESELAWVESLRASGLDAPEQRPNRDGRGYSAVTVGDETRQVGVIEWVDGVQLETALESDPTTVSLRYRQLGELAARIHLHAESWTPPAGFERRRWDAEGLVGERPLWGRFWEVPALAPAERQLFDRARRSLYQTLSDMDDDRSEFGLIHADLHLRNVLVDGERLVIIDFDDAGHGWYLHEFGVALQSALGEPWFGLARSAMIDGYRSLRPLPDSRLDLLDAFLAIRSLMLVAWLDARPELGLDASLPYLVAEAVEQASRYLSSDLAS